MKPVVVSSAILVVAFLSARFPAAAAAGTTTAFLDARRRPTTTTQTTTLRGRRDPGGGVAAFVPFLRRQPPPLPNGAIARPASSLMAVDVSGIEETVSPRALVGMGMQAFRRSRAKSDVASSVDYFDRATAAGGNSIAPYLWQRGLSCYYADLFKEGSEQFRLDVKMNPLDVEEIVWDIACLARLDPDAPFPPTEKMALPKGKTDRRRIMSTVYSLYRGDGATEHDLADAGHNGNISDEFYSLFYLGLYCEIRGETSKAESYMKAASATSYAKGPGAGDYMTSCASVHCSLRGWT